MHKKSRRRALKFNVSSSNPNKSKMYHLLMRDSGILNKCSDLIYYIIIHSYTTTHTLLSHLRIVSVTSQENIGYCKIMVYGG